MYKFFTSCLALSGISSCSDNRKFFIRSALVVVTILLASVSKPVIAQTTVTISGGDNFSDNQNGPGAYTPSTNLYCATVSLYRGTGTTDLTTWGYITGLAWYYDYGGSTPVGSYNLPVNIWLKTFGSTATLTTGTTFGSYTTGATNVFTGNLTCGGASGYYGVTLTTPFLLPVTTNLLVLPEEGSQSVNNMQFWGDAYTNLATWYGGGSAATAGSAFANYAYRASIQLTFGKPVISVQPPATASLCTSSGTATNISMTSSVTTTYEWQYSANGTTGWVDVSNNTPVGAVYTNTATNSLGVSSISANATYYYHCIVKNGNGASSTTTTGNTAFTVASCCTAPSALTYTLNTPTYCNGAVITNNSPSFIGSAATSYSVSPTLPAGLSLNTGTGVISGTPIAAVSSGSYTVTVNNACGSTTKVLSITVTPVLSVTVTPNPLTFCVNSATTLTAAASGGSGTFPSYAWSSSTTGNGLGVSTTSSDNATPTKPGTQTYAVTVTDGNNCTAASTPVNVTVKGTTTVTTTGATGVTSGGGTLNGTIVTE